jgi:uncharacterized protein
VPSTRAPSQARSRFAQDYKILIPITESAAAVSFAIKVHPRAKTDAITGEVGDALKLSLTAPPVEGRANEACIEFLSKFLNVPRSSITIAAGESGRRKVIRVSGISAAQVREKLLAVSS